jgi:hypothetical protein
MAKKVQFTLGSEKYEAYWNGKEYRQGMVYMSISRIGGTNAKKASYSKERESFVDYQAGDLDLAKAAASALGFIA